MSIEGGPLDIEAGLLGFDVVWHEDCLLHRPDGEVWLGARDPGTEIPGRATAILAALTSAGARIVPPRPQQPATLTAVHDPALVEHLATIWAAWEAGGYPADYGRDRVVPYVFPTAAMLAGLPRRLPAAVHAQVGMFCYDTMTLVGPGSWEAIRAAADSAASAAELVASGRPAAYALCRPPGHHAGPAGYGGSCYLNNAAVAAQALRDGGAARVAIIDLDAHHGNGTQAIFYDRADVFYGSLHIDPGAGWFPHYMGFAAERGGGPGLGTNRNIPLPPATADEAWLAAVAELCGEAADFGAEAVVLSLGVDAAAADPESPLEVTADAYRTAGELAGRLGPLVAVQEGGYHLPSLGAYVVATLAGVRAGRGVAGGQ
jgi:acetoin utilization deacetylase AcuC-like enzyme